MSKVGQFNPVVTVDVDTGKIETDWFQSFVWVVDDDGSTGDDTDDRGTATVIDERLDEIRAMLGQIDSDGADRATLADYIRLTRPFFDRVDSDD